MPNRVQRIIVGYQGERRIIHKPSTYERFIEAARRRFSIPDDAELSLRLFPDLGSSAAVGLSAEFYEDVRDLSYITFTTAAQSCLHDEPVAMMPQHCVNEDAMKRKKNRTSLIGIYVKTMPGKTIRFVCEPSTIIIQLRWAIRAAEGIPPDQTQLVFAGKRLVDGKAFEDYGIHDGSTIHLVLTLRGGKPAIYLLSPVLLEDVNVSVTLSPQWSFTVLYPLAKPVTDAKHNTSRVEWIVSVQGETISDYSTGTKCSYLFWEAETGKSSAALPVTAADTHAANGSGEVFNPSTPSLMPENACVLSFEDFVPCLECILEGLCLTPAMRTEFIIYWLPRFQHIRDQGLYIAFRFVSQDAFNRAARLEITGCPPPTAIARIFMLFGGVSPLEPGSPWGGTTCTRTEAQSFDWAKTIEFDVNSWDRRNFRVLEWGGMEVPDSMLK
ncbi:hypothetical protein BR93DRAFT_976850 [Coniochaeta sp. PMI_546]|nr:hypothetical protein BR93DRAFT_976850 [Coniochaeta sp. PMI_546]